MTTIQFREQMAERLARQVWADKGGAGAVGPQETSSIGARHSAPSAKCNSRPKTNSLNHPEDNATRSSEVQI